MVNWSMISHRFRDGSDLGDVDQLFQDMLKEGVIVRAMRGYKLPGWVRISVGTPEENQRCLEVLDRCLVR